MWGAYISRYEHSAHTTLGCVACSGSSISVQARRTGPCACVPPEITTVPSPSSVRPLVGQTIPPRGRDTLSDRGVTPSEAKGPWCTVPLVRVRARQRLYGHARHARALSGALSVSFREPRRSPTDTPSRDNKCLSASCEEDGGRARTGKLPCAAEYLSVPLTRSLEYITNLFV